MGFNFSLSNPNPFPYKFRLTRLRLNNGGYDSSGSYWGVGQPLYYYEDYDTNEDGEDGHLRADDREHAKARLKCKYPNCTFYR